MENQTIAISNTKKKLNKFYAYVKNPSHVILLVCAVLLALTVLVPLVYLLINTIQVHHGEIGEVGSITGNHWSKVLDFSEYSKKVFWLPLLNSVGMSLTACLIAVVAGGVTAWLITRSNIPFKKFISAVFIFPYVMPSWSIAMFWENIFVNSALPGDLGKIGTLQMLTGICAPEWMVYGFLPCAIALGIHYAPFAYILIGGILRNMDANLEEAATILKANRFQILYKITLPIVMPALISTVLLVFASSISSYTVPMFLGKGDFKTLSLSMKSLLSTSAKSGQGYVIAVIMLLFSVLILTFNQLATGKRKSFTTVTGKSSQVSLVKLGWFKWIITPIVLIYVIFFAIVPLISFGLESVLEKSGDLSSLTFKYWTSDVELSTYIPGSYGIFKNATIWTSFGNSLLVSGIVAICAGTLGILIGYAVARNRGSKLASGVSAIAFFPYLIPAMSFSAIYLAVACTPAFGFLYESLFLLILVGSIKFLPFASRSGTNAMLQVSKEIEEAAVIVGTPWHKRMTRILFPIQKSSLISGYLLPFVSCMRELTLFVLIAGSGTILTAVLSTYETYDMVQMSNGINLIVIVTVLVVNFGVNKLTGASIDKGIGG